MRLPRFIAAILLCLSMGCSKGGDGNTDPINPPPAQKQVKLSIGLKTRVSETTFDNSDQVGLYMVYYNGTTPGTLANTGNGAHNVQYTFDGSQWNAATPLYWKDNSTHADFYVYHPYGSPYNVNAHNFNIKENQSAESDYKASDFVWGKKTDSSPADEYINIQTSHIMSCMIIKLAAGDGLTDEDIANGEISIAVNGIKTGTSINLANGEVTASGDPTTVCPLKKENEWKIIIAPQDVPEQNLITITLDGQEYNLKKGFTFVQGKKYTFTVTLSKGSSGINVNISDWDDDGTDYGGVAE